MSIAPRDQRLPALRQSAAVCLLLAVWQCLGCGGTDTTPSSAVPPQSPGAATAGGPGTVNQAPQQPGDAVAEQGTTAPGGTQQKSAGEPAKQDPVAATSFELDPGRQDEIWEAEHITFELEKCVGPRFWNAVKAAGVTDFESVLRADFRGSAAMTSESDGAVNFQSVKFSSQVGADDSLTQSAAEFSEALQSELRGLSDHKSTKFRVLSIVHDAEQPERWRCRIYLASNGTAPGGALVHFSSENDVVFRFADEAELHDRPVIESWRMAKRGVETVERPLFSEVTEQIGLSNTGIDDNWKLPPERVIQYRFQMAVEDFDQDGWLDIATAENHQSRIFQWQPGLKRYVQTTDRLGVTSIHGSSGSGNSLAGFFDMDNDGDPDLLLGNRLYRNEEGRRFTDMTKESGLRFLKKAMGSLFADFDADGLLDIYILYQGSRVRSGTEPPLSWIQDDQAGEDNHLWKNLGDGRFRNVTDSRHAGGGKRHTLAGVVFHDNDDHLPDLYLANDFAENNLLRNDGKGGFVDVSKETGTSDYATSMGVAAGDVDNDGRTDLYVANMFSKMGRRIIGHVSAADYPEGVFPLIQGSCAGNRLYRRTDSESHYDEFGEQLGIHDVGWAYAPTMADLNRDGLLDLYATTGFLSFRRNEPDG